ncbi:MAG TPA: hypothetical protein VLA93_05530 [Pyrinomonadaceae bacterium]|nr:hypothetical protein [Pyrinomonadaceae bacterium]
MRKLSFAFLTILLVASVATADTLYLRDGRSLRGTLLGFINGRFAFRVSTTQTTPLPSNAPVRPQEGAPVRPQEGEIQFFRPNEVERIEIDGRSLDDVRYESRNVEVQLGPSWIDSGIDLRRGERVQVNASGIILAGRSRITPDGLRTTDPRSPLPSAAEGMLIGAIGNNPNSPILELGTSKEFVADEDGRLFLTSNRGSYSDARGSFTVQIKRERDLTALIPSRQPNPMRPRPRQTDIPVQRTPQESFLDVAGTSRGTDTRLDVRVGDEITFTATGKIVAGRRLGEVGPEGARSSGFGSIVGTRPVPSAGAGALIGYIRMANGQVSQPFFIGSQLTLSVPADGRLYLAINDDDYSDNGGAFRVTIKY